MNIQYLYIIFGFLIFGEFQATSNKNHNVQNDKRHINMNKKEEEKEKEKREIGTIWKFFFKCADHVHAQ